MSVKMKVEGFREIERALADLPRGTAKSVVRRAMKKELTPIANMANALWPGSDDDVFRISPKVSRSQKGDSKALTGASIVNMFVGANKAPAVGAPHAHLIEFGTGPRSHESGKFVGAVSPQPMLQPAWDAHSLGLLEGLGARIWDEIAKTLARRAKKAAKGK
ncbi:hypothetical protein [Mameliella alba]|uniref:hypothetical protein n=1 Tax=Mameliella alba TaxID=561184 RepID=UPI0028F6C3EB|nr:hypothetical protein [Mameliella alba]